ncbi:pericentrin-like [Gossypium australe]|uniref:Pericentrin-like n=1 Tax=Gossypium australe TaxID=47621 RepID=A0A5B6X3H8_9ROSI|nr:pericentrin-like [Gossypium australe]
MGEAVAQVREVADHLQTLAVQADVLSLKYESESDRGRELAWLLRKVKALITLEYCYGTRGRTKAMDQRLERLEQMQKEMQDQLQIHMQEQLAKIQQDMRDQMLESQRNMISQLTQLLTGGLEKGKSPKVNSEDDNEDPAYPPGFTPTNTQAQPNVYPQRVFVNIKPQYQTGTSAPISFPTGSGSNPRDNPANPVVPDLYDMAEIEKTRVELSKQLED